MDILQGCEDYTNYTFDKYVERYFVLKAELNKKELALAELSFVKLYKARLVRNEYSLAGYFELYTQILG